MDDATLLKKFAAERSHEAFSQLVGRHQDWVYSCCLRRLGDASQAEDAAQGVFMALARHAGELVAKGEELRLEGWLHVAARHAAANLRRAQSRRVHHEREAAAMKAVQTDDQGWATIEPELEGALDRMAASDREAIVLRFFAQVSFAEVGTRLAISEEAAKKRVQRALGRLRVMLGAKGTTVAAMGGLLLAHAVRPVPRALAAGALAPAGSAGETIAESVARGMDSGVRRARWLAAGAVAAVVAILLGLLPSVFHRSGVPKGTVVAAGTAPAATETAATQVAATAGSRGTRGVNLPTLTFTGFSEREDDIVKRYARIFDGLDEKREAEAALQQRANAAVLSPGRAAEEAAIRAEMARTTVRLWDKIEAEARQLADTGTDDMEQMAKAPRLPVNPADVGAVYPALRERMLLHVIKEEQVQPMIDALNTEYARQKEVLGQLAAWPEAAGAIRELLDAGNALNLTNNAPGGREKFYVRMTWAMGQVGDARVNPLTVEVTRDGERCALAVFSSQLHVPLMYVTNDLMIELSATAPGHLVHLKANPGFELRGGTGMTHFAAGAMVKQVGIDLNMESLLQAMSKDIRLAKLKGDVLDLTMPHTLVTYHLDRAAGAFPLTGMDITPLPGQDAPTMRLWIDGKKPRQDLLGVGMEKFKALPGMKIDEAEGLLGLPAQLAAIYTFMMMDLEKRPEMLAAARKMGNVVREEALDAGPAGQH